jgi:hypothetical protein
MNNLEDITITKIGVHKYSCHGCNQSDVSSMLLENWPTVQNGMLYACIYIYIYIIYISFYSIIIVQQSKHRAFLMAGKVYIGSVPALNVYYLSKEVPLYESMFLWWKPLIFRQSISVQLWYEVTQADGTQQYQYWLSWTVLNSW